MLAGEIILLFIALYLLVLVSMFTLQIVSSIIKLKTVNYSAVGTIPSFAVIIPAHDEELIIVDTLNSVMPQLRTGDQVLVVADNCSDKTADVARACGATVVERYSTTNLGKGYALEFGVAYLSERNFDVDYVVFVDADCNVGSESLETLVRCCADTQRPVQALYLMKAVGLPAVKQKIAEFAWRVKNHARPLGMMNLGLPCQLMGSGMAFPRELIENADLGTTHIVEDMKLGIDLARQGYSPLFCPDAVIESYFPVGEKAIGSQRTRWEHGHLATMSSEVMRMLVVAFGRLDKQLLAMAFDLLIPPMAFLVMVLSLLTGLTAISVGLFEFGYEAFVLLIAANIILICAIFLAWYRFGRDILSSCELLSIPIYVLSKIPMYLRYWIQRQTKWVRTDRE